MVLTEAKCSVLGLGQCEDSAEEDTMVPARKVVTVYSSHMMAYPVDLPSQGAGAPETGQCCAHLCPLS